MTDKIKISIGSDHAATELKNIIITYLGEYDVIDHGCFGTDSVDYPDYAIPVCRDVVTKEARFGILICGTGIGMSMAANKIDGIRAGLCTSEFMAEATRHHNDANVLCLGARVTSIDDAVKITSIFLKTAFEGGKHLKRIDKFAAIEKDGINAKINNLCGK